MSISGGMELLVCDGKARTLKAFLLTWMQRHVVILSIGGYFPSFLSTTD